MAEETRYVQVKKIIFEDCDTHYVIFSAETMKIRPRKKDYVGIREIRRYCGIFVNIGVGDIYEVTSVARAGQMGEVNDVITYKRTLPVLESEIKKFLISKCKGLSEARFKKLYELYGINVLKEISADPNVLVSVGVPKGYAEDFRNRLLLDSAYQDTLLLLQIYGLDCSHVQALYERYQRNTAAILKTAPFTPYIDGIFSFDEADALHGKLLKSGADSERLAMCLYEYMRCLVSRSGSVFEEKTLLAEGLADFLERHEDSHGDSVILSESLFEEILRFLLDKEYLIAEETLSGDIRIYLSALYKDEQTAAAELCRLLLGKKTIHTDASALSQLFDDNANYGLSEEQADAAKLALLSPVFILTGGPGTGKTQTIKAILDGIKQLCPGANIQLAAPTGKAANRMEEQTGFQAKTIHRLLGLKGRYKTKPDPLCCDALILDECSMIDISLMRILLENIPTSCKVVFVGDANQLPPVGPGLPLLDMLNCGAIEAATLTRVFRQREGSLILENACRLLDGSGSFKFGNDVSFTSCQDDELKKTLWDEFSYLRMDGYGLDDIQVLTPLKHPANGVYSLNRYLQRKISKNSIKSYSTDEKEFRLGDKVIHIENDYDLGVFNGETGFISEISYEQDNALSVEYFDKTVDYRPSELKELELAYALSVHKSQGNEFPVVIIPITRSLLSGYNKKVLYTAITRAREKVVFIGEKKALKSAILKEDRKKRTSGLGEKLIAGLQSS